MAAARKTLAESKAEAFSAGFYTCMNIIMREWRRIHGPGTGPSQLADLWPIIEKMEAYGGLYDEDFKALNSLRLGYDFKRLRVRVEVLHPHPHAGRKGFILDSETKADNAFAPPHQLRKLKEKRR